MTQRALIYSPATPARFLLSPIGWPTFALMVVSALMYLVGAAAVPSFTGPRVLGILGWVSVAAILLMRGVVRVTVAVVDERWSALRHGWFRWLVPPIIFAAVHVLVTADVPLRVAFRLSKPEMDRLAEQVLASPSATHRSRQVGLYSATEIRRLPIGPIGMRFGVRGTEFMFAGGGVAYCPSGPPRTSTSAGTDIYKPLGGGWYAWTWHQ